MQTPPWSEVRTMSNLPEDLIILIMKYARQHSSFEDKLKFNWFLVCRRWYSIVMNTPHLWGYIAVSDRKPARQASYLTRAVLLSRTRPLYIDMRISDDALYHECLNILVDHSPRWKTCNMLVPTIRLYDRPCLTLSASLHRLRVSATDSSSATTSVSFLSNPIYLRTLILEGVSYLPENPTVLHNLNALSLRGFRIKDICTLLSRCPSLQVLYFTQTGVIEWDEDSIPFLDPIELNSLVELHVASIQLEDLFLFFKRVHLPSIKKLILSHPHGMGSTDPWWFSRNPLHFLSLRHLAIEASGAISEPLFNIIHDNPTILHLTLIGVPEEDAAKVFNSELSKAAVPNLVSLTSDSLFSHFLQTAVVQPRKATLRQVNMVILRGAGVSIRASQELEIRNEAARKWLKENVELRLFDRGFSRTWSEVGKRCESFATERVMNPFSIEDVTIRGDELWLPYDPPNWQDVFWEF